MSACWICGKKQGTDVRGRPRPMQEHSVDGKPVSVHRSCAEEEGLNRKAPRNGRLPEHERSFVLPSTRP